ncbi:MAG: hypothetical protein EXX96DRAFT_472796 [Benjaminiella poitrasii]|nr:MAG: hypothetical protein EXX96DRAFT_472796 [Benjaminiella poitrasii]
MTHNQFEEIPGALYELKQLKELNLSHNQIKGEVALPDGLELLDLSYNEISRFTANSASTLSKLNLSHNQLTSLPSIEGWSKLQELQVNQNRLIQLFAEKEILLPLLVRLNAGNNLISTLTSNSKPFYVMPRLVELSVTTNKLKDEKKVVEFLKGAPKLQTLDVSSNKLETIHGFGSLSELQRLDVRGNQLHTLPYDLGQLENLKVVLCDGNPMRTYISMSQTQLIETLKSSYQQQKNEEENDVESELAIGSEEVKSNVEIGFDDKSIIEISSQFSEMTTLNSREKLNLSNKQLSELPSNMLTFSDNSIPGTILLDHNIFTSFPSTSLNIISNFIVHINLEHNHLTTFNFTIQNITFAHLKTLNLSNNRIKTIECTLSESSFPKLEELILNYNLITTLPENLVSNALPSLKILSASSNKLDQITERCFMNDKQGVLEVLDLSNNDIGYLPPGLSQIETLRELIVFGNRFRVPRPDVVAQGTRAILEFLKRRFIANK